MPIKNMLISALFLALFAVAGTGLVAMTHEATKERIAENERQALLHSMHQLISPESHDNDIYTDFISVLDKERLGSTNPINIYRARMGGAPVAAVLASVAPDGYGGSIKLLVAINYDGILAGVRVVAHKETPGLGDGIEAERSDWILGFTGRSLTDPTPEKWKVKKDGGIFDQFTGATITPRAIVKAVYNSLQYFRQHREAVFAAVESVEEQNQ